MVARCSHYPLGRSRASPRDGDPSAACAGGRGSEALSGPDLHRGPLPTEAPASNNGTPSGHHWDTTGTPDGTPDGTPAGHRRTPTGGRRSSICLDFALATEGSFLSPAHAASPRPLARTNETKRFPGWGHSVLTPQPPITATSTTWKVTRQIGY